MSIICKLPRKRGADAIYCVRYDSDRTRTSDGTRDSDCGLGSGACRRDSGLSEKRLENGGEKADDALEDF